MGRGMILASDLSKSGTWSKETKLSQAPWASGRPCLAGGPLASMLHAPEGPSCTWDSGFCLAWPERTALSDFLPVPQAQIVFLEAERSLQPGVWLSCGLWYPRSSCSPGFSVLP